MKSTDFLPVELVEQIKLGRVEGRLGGKDAEKPFVGTFVRQRRTCARIRQLQTTDSRIRCTQKHRNITKDPQCYPQHWPKYPL